MKLRARRGFYSDRQQTRCICEWCGKPFVSQRSDSKYCCDSHKTLACNKRNRLKLEQKRTVEKIRYTQPVPPVKATVGKPEVASTIINREPEGHSEEQMDKLKNEVNVMIQNYAKEKKQREEKMAVDDVIRKLVAIGENLKDWSRGRFVRRSQLASMERMVISVVDHPNAIRMSQFHEHLRFLSESLLPYIKETKTKFFKEGVYRLTMQLPDYIKSGMALLLVLSPAKL